MEYKNMNEKEIRTTFDKLTLYGLDLLYEVVEAWQFNYEEDGKILKKAYIDVLEVKSYDNFDENNEPSVKVRRLKKSLADLNEKELAFLEDLLELDPFEVFIDNPYTSNEKEDIGISQYEEMCKHVRNERNKRESLNVRTKKLFYKRYTKSMNSSDCREIRPYSF